MTSYYSFTFTIPGVKKVYYSGRKRAFGSMNLKAQHTFLNDLMTKIIWNDSFKFIDWVYEKHEDERLHIHGFVCVDEFLAEAPIRKLQRDFYQHKNIVNMAETSYMRLSHVEKTYKDVKYWKKYIDKHQDEIIYHSPTYVQFMLFQNLDKGVIIERPPLIDTSADDYYDTYRFGTQNKFTVEM